MIMWLRWPTILTSLRLRGFLGCETSGNKPEKIPGKPGWTGNLTSDLLPANGKWRKCHVGYSFFFKRVWACSLSLCAQWEIIGAPTAILELELTLRKQSKKLGAWVPDDGVVFPVLHYCHSSGIFSFLFVAEPNPRDYGFLALLCLCPCPSRFQSERVTSSTRMM